MKRGESYLNAVRRGLEDAPPADRERLMRRLTEAVYAFLEENPEALEADVVQAFGPPEKCAAELLEECDPVQVAAVRRKRRMKLYAVIAVLVILAVIVLLILLLRGGFGLPPADAGSHTGHFRHGFGHHA